MKQLMVAADITKRIAFGPCVIYQIAGYNPNATGSGDDRYIQLHQAMEIAASDVPAIKSLYAPGNTAFDWQFPQGLYCSELMVGISTTEALYTAAGGGGGLDLNIIFESQCPWTSAHSLVGDYSTPVAGKTMWSEASGLSAPKRLMRVDVKNFNNGNNRRIVVFAHDAPSVDSVATQTRDCGSNGTDNRIFFGKGGLVPFAKSTDGTLRRGCQVRLLDISSIPYAFESNVNYYIRGVVETM